MEDQLGVIGGGTMYCLIVTQPTTRHRRQAPGLTVESNCITTLSGDLFAWLHCHSEILSGWSFDAHLCHILALLPHALDLQYPSWVLFLRLRTRAHVIDCFCSH